VRVQLNFQQNPPATQNAGSTAGAVHGAPAAPAGGTSSAPSVPVVTQLTEGSVLQATVTRGIAPDAPASSQPAVPGQAAAPSAAQPAATATAAATPAALAAGSNLTVRVLGVTPPGGALPAAPPLAATAGAPTIAATVTGHQAGAATVVTADGVELTLPNAHPLPTGSSLLLEVTNLRPPLTGPDGAPLSFLAGGRWEALHDALSLLNQIDPALVRHVLDTAIPNPGPRMGATMLFLLSAVFSGDVRRFLGGEALRQLGRTADGVRERVGREFGQLQRTATDASGQDWRVFYIPILTEEGLEQIRFMLHRQDEEGGGAEGDAGTRFMIEVNMSRLGPIQFDGLTRQKHLDLVVRTQRPFPEQMVDEIRSIFGNTIAALGFTGTIALRVVPRFDIAPVDQVGESHKDFTV
jgi:hypothetical protein